MSITTSNPDGVRITSAAKNGTLGSQAGNANDEITFDTAISTNNGNLVGSPTFVGRLVIIRQGDVDEELRYIAEIVSGNQVRVDSDWISNPASGDTYHISYIVQDAATVTGFSLINKRQDDYSSTRKFRIGNSGGGTFAFFAILDGASIESVDNGSTTEADIVVETDGYFSIGYSTLGTPVSGGALFGTPATAGEFVLDAVSGSYVDWYDLYVKCVFSNKMEYKGTALFHRVKIFKGIYTFDATGIITMLDSVLEGVGTANDYIIVDSTTDIVSLAVIATNGFTTADDSVTETITIKNCVWVGTGLLITAHNDKTFRVINPTWAVDAGTQDDLSFPVDDANSVEERYTLEVPVTESDGTAIVGARVLIYEASNDDIQHDGETDSSGDYSVDIIRRIYTYATATTLATDERTGFALRVFEYGKTPFVGAISVDAPAEQPIALSDDPNIFAPNAASALNDGSAIVVTQDANPNTLLSFDTGSGVLNPGDTVTGGTSGADGVLVEIAEGDEVSGKLFLKTRDANAFQQNEALGNGGSWTGEVVNSGSFYQDFTWHIECQGVSLQIAYDYLAARMEQTTLETWAEAAHEWGAGVESQLLYFGAGGYFTAMNGSEGVYVSERGAGAVQYFTDDDDNTYTPPTQYSHVLTGIQENSEVTYVRVSDETVLYHVENVGAGGSTTYNYTYGGSDVTVDILIFHVNYEPIAIQVDLSNSDGSIPITQTADNVYLNPA